MPPRFWCCLSAWLLACQGAGAVQLVTEHYPPFNLVDPRTGAVSGLVTDRIRALLARAGEPYTIMAVPWPRAMRMAQNDADTCVFSTARTPAREALYQWVGPLVPNRLTLFARADDARRPRSVAELKRYVIGTKRNDASSEFFQAAGIATDPANADADNPQKLLNGRFDFWSTGELLGLEILKEQGLEKRIVPVYGFQQVDMYLACNKNMAAEKIARWNRALRELSAPERP